MQQNVTLFFTELLVGLDEMYHLTWKYFVSETFLLYPNRKHRKFLQIQLRSWCMYWGQWKTFSTFLNTRLCFTQCSKKVMTLKCNKNNDAQGNTLWIISLKILRDGLNTLIIVHRNFGNNLENVSSVTAFTAAVMCFWKSNTVSITALSLVKPEQRKMQVIHHCNPMSDQESHYSHCCVKRYTVMQKPPMYQIYDHELDSCQQVCQ